MKPERGSTMLCLRSLFAFWPRGRARLTTMRYPITRRTATFRTRTKGRIQGHPNATGRRGHDKNEKLRVAGGPEVTEKLKSRLVIRGDLEKKPSAQIVRLQAECVCPHPAVLCGREQPGAEVWRHQPAAFLQGASIRRTLILTAPKDGIVPTEEGDDVPPMTYTSLH